MQSGQPVLFLMGAATDASSQSQTFKFDSAFTFNVFARSILYIYIWYFNQEEQGIYLNQDHFDLFIHGSLHWYAFHASPRKR